MRRALTERLVRGFDPRVASILRVGGGAGGGGGVLPSGEFLIWVTKGGSDATGDGTDEAPYLTLGKAMSVAKTLAPTATQLVLVLVGPGTYNEDLRVPPFVEVVAADTAGQSVFVGTGGVGVPAIALDSAAWAPATSGYSSVTGILTNFALGNGQGNIAIDFTGVTSSGSFNLTRIGVAGSVSVTGDDVGGGFLFLVGDFVDVNVTVTGAQLTMSQGTGMFGTLAVVSTAAQPASAEIITSAAISNFGSLGAVTLDATAGQNVTVQNDGAVVEGTLTLKDGGGGVTSFQATVGGIPGHIVRTGGAAAPVLVRYASTQLPDTTFIIYVNKSGDDTNGNGTDGAPYLTISKAMTVAATLPLTFNQPAQILVGPGVYAESISWVPNVIVTGLDASTLGFFLTGSVTLDHALWVAAGAANLVLGGLSMCEVGTDVTLDFTGVNAGGFFGEFFFGATVNVDGNLSVTGDATGPVSGLFIINTSATVGGTTTFTGLSVETHGTVFGGDLVVASSATVNVPWQSFGDSILANVTLNASAGQAASANLIGTGYGAGATLTLHDGGGGHTSYTATIGGVPGTVTRLGGAAAPVTVPVYAAAFAPILPPALPPVPITYASGSITGTGNQVASTSDQGAITVMAIAGGSNRDFTGIDATELLAVAGGGGTAAANYGLPAQFCGKVHVCVVGTGATGSDGFCEEATATVRVTAGGVAAFPAAVGGSSNPTLNPWLDKVSDTTFNSGGGVPSAIALTVAGGNLVVTVTNNGVGANNFVVYFHHRSFGSP